MEADLGKNEIYWYGFGWASFRASSSIPFSYLPPVNDEEAQLSWLAGFLSGRVDQPDYPHWNVPKPCSGWVELKKKLAAEYPCHWEVLSKCYLTQKHWIISDSFVEPHHSEV
jgi:hypothetical protein